MKNRKKIAIALNMLAPYWVEPFNSLARLGYDIKVFVAEKQESNREYNVNYYENNIFSYKKNKNFDIDLRRLKIRTEFLHFQFGLWFDLKEFKPQLIISNGLGFRSLVVLTYCIIFSIPFIPWVCMTNHTERNISQVRRLIRKFILKHAKSVCTNLTEGQSYLLKNFSIEPNKIFTTPYVINVSTFHQKVEIEKKNIANFRKKNSLHEFIFLYVGQMIARKGIHELIKSLISLEEETKDIFSILFVGGKLDDTLFNILIKNKISFLNISFVQPNELPIYYASADALIFPSLEDEWGIVLNEAASAGLPIISSKYAGATMDIVKNGINGYIIDPLEKNNISETLKLTLSLSKNDLNKMGQNSLKIIKNLDIGFSVDQLSKAIKSSLNN